MTSLKLAKHLSTSTTNSPTQLRTTIRTAQTDRRFYRPQHRRTNNLVLFDNYVSSPDNEAKHTAVLP